MTTQHPEEVRRQFEAEVPGLVEMSELLLSRGINTRCFRDHEIAEATYRIGYQAALRSPAVAGLVELVRAAANYVDVLGGDSKNYRAALAQFATLAGESHE